MLEHLSNLHESVEATKASLAQTQEVLSSDMNTLLSKLDQAISLVAQERQNRQPELPTEKI